MSTERGQSQRLQVIVETIVQVARPERVILFGSRAKGTARDESDYDFLVVVRGIRNEREVSRRIYRALLDRKVGAAVDVVVVDTKALERHRESPFYVYRQALQEGRVFYERGGI
ncbi:MAG: nucleotidyltransferase domain-containing protein [Anaerolineae bacterium]|nr:nucleotidyltransferase domain-containing protein [Anaerolineae bacterium]